MKVFHQAGHNLVWNLHSLEKDGAGDGIIFSPVNDGPARIGSLSTEIRAKSLIDPQFYVPASGRGKLQEYPFFPSSVLDEFTTVDFETVCWDVASQCVNWQVESGFSEIIIPVRYYSDLPSDYFEQMLSCYIEPFIASAERFGYDGKILLTIIVKSSQMADSEQKNLLLNWVTGIPGIDGVYLIFEHSSPNKQIKDPVYLSNCLSFISVLKENDLIVNIGYTNTEGLLFSLAGPDSISMGVYENLRRFDPRRFEIQEEQHLRQPSPRLYSSVLCQWIEFTYVQAIQQLYGRWEDLFEQTHYMPMDFRPGANWNLKQPELYKHFFMVFSRQVASLHANLDERSSQLKSTIAAARSAFSDIDSAGIPLDGNSDGSHLNAWQTAISLYERM